MKQLLVRTGTRFDGTTFGNLVVPPELDDASLQHWTEKLEATGLTVRPGYDEKREHYLLRLTNAESPEALSTSISKALGETGHEIAYKDATAKEKPEGLNKLSEWAYEHAPVVYENAGHITGAFFFGAAACFAKSAVDNNDHAKKITALGLATSASIIGLYAGQPKDPQDIHTILADVKSELAEKGSPDLGKLLQEKDSFLTQTNETLRRYHWEAASLINIPANAFWLAGSVNKAMQGDYNWLQPAVSAAMTANNAIRVVMPQKGGQSILGKLPFEATQNFAQKLENGDIPFTGWLRDNPVNMTSNISNAGKVAGVAAGMMGGRNSRTEDGKSKGDPWLSAAMPIEFVGNMFAKMSGKPVGIGLDEIATTGADFVAKWDYQGTEEQKIDYVAKKLAKRKEIVHSESDIAEGIRLRLAFEEQQARRESATALADAYSSASRYTEQEQHRWASRFADSGNATESGPISR